SAAADPGRAPARLRGPRRADDAPGAPAPRSALRRVRPPPRLGLPRSIRKRARVRRGPPRPRRLDRGPGLLAGAVAGGDVGRAGAAAPDPGNGATVRRVRTPGRARRGVAPARDPGR